MAGPGVPSKACFWRHQAAIPHSPNLRATSTSLRWCQIWGERYSKEKDNECSQGLGDLPCWKEVDHHRWLTIGQSQAIHQAFQDLLHTGNSFLHHLRTSKLVAVSNKHGAMWHFISLVPRQPKHSVGRCQRLVIWILKVSDPCPVNGANQAKICFRLGPSSLLVHAACSKQTSNGKSHAVVCSLETGVLRKRTSNDGVGPKYTTATCAACQHRESDRRSLGSTPGFPKTWPVQFKEHKLTLL